jgi:hypothetical protein
MIQMQVDPKSIDKFSELINKKIKAIEFVVSPSSLTEIGKTIFIITAKRFLQDISVAAKADPKRFHHIYEWGAVGQTSKKLFLIKRSHVQYGQLEIEFIFSKSTKPVPIPARLLQPARTRYNRRIFASSRHIFRDKASIMEKNDPVHIITKRTIVFTPDGSQLVFVPKDKVINIMNPGGVKTTHALAEFSEIWYTMKAPAVITRSRLINNIVKEVVSSINTGNNSPSQVSAIIKNTNSKYSGETSVL